MAGLSRLRWRFAVARTFGSATRRSYAAAAAQWDYDFDYYEEDRRRVAEPVVDGAGSEPRRGVQWVIIGEPGAKKHVYAERLSKLLEVPHISMGSLVRQELNPRSSLYKQIENAVNQGKLVPEDIIFGLLSKRLEEGYSRGENGFILDGIPRTKLQAEILDEIADIDLVLNFKCTEKARRHISRGLNLQSQDKHINSLCSSEVAWKEKLRTYSEQSKPLEEYYQKQKKLLEFQVAGAPDETWPGLLAALHLQLEVANSTRPEFIINPK